MPALLYFRHVPFLMCLKKKVDIYFEFSKMNTGSKRYAHGTPTVKVSKYLVL